MVDRTMRGVYPILAMPFDEQSRIDVEDLQREVDFAIEAGVHGVGIAMASEIFKLSESERDLATTTVVEQVRGRVKVVVNTGARLSLQSHQHRAEHWVVVAGTAAVTLGGDALTLAVGQSVYIPAGTKHRLANEADVPLKIIEVQTGDYLGEDDIIRFDDDYGRS